MSDETGNGATTTWTGGRRSATKETVPGRAETEETEPGLPGVWEMGRARLTNGRAVRSMAAGSTNNLVHSELATRGVDGGIECGAQIAAGGRIGRGEGKSDEVDPVATTRVASCAAKGRKRWKQTV